MNISQFYNLRDECETEFMKRFPSAKKLQEKIPLAEWIALQAEITRQLRLYLEHSQVKVEEDGE